MMRPACFMILLAAALGACMSAPGFAQTKLGTSIVCSGAASHADANNVAVTTLGQPFVGNASCPTHIGSSGFWYARGGFATAMEAGQTLPVEFQMEQNYPNPFNPSTVISYQLSAASWVRLVVYDILGREVAALVDGRQQAGPHDVIFRASGLASGPYFYRLEAKDDDGKVHRIIRKMMLLR